MAEPSTDIPMADSAPTEPVNGATSEPPAAAAPVISSTSTPAPPPAAAVSIPMPERANAHGSPTRVYLNQNVTPHLLEGMKYIAAYEPEKPLKWLSEFLAKKSAELEGQ